MIRNQDTCFVAEQSAFGTPETTGFKPLPIAGGATVGYNGADFKSLRSSASTATRISRKGNYHWALTLQLELDASNFIFVLKNFLGKYDYTVDTPVAGANQHVCSLATTAAEKAQLSKAGFTLETGGDGKYFIWDSCVITSMEFGEIEQGVIPVTVNVLAREKAEAGTSNGGSFAPNPDAQVFDTLQTEFKVGVDGSEVIQPFTMTGLSLDRGVTAHHRASANTALEFTLGEFTEISGTFEIEVGDTERAAVLDDFLNSDEASVIITYTSDQIITGSTPFSLTLDMAECKITVLDPRTDEHRRWEKFGFECGTESGTDGDAIIATVISDLTTF